MLPYFIVRQNTFARDLFRLPYLVHQLRPCRICETPALNFILRNLRAPNLNPIFPREKRNYSRPAGCSPRLRNTSFIRPTGWRKARVRERCEPEQGSTHLLLAKMEERLAHATVGASCTFFPVFLVILAFVLKTMYAVRKNNNKNNKNKLRQSEPSCKSKLTKKTNIGRCCRGSL